MRLEVLRVKRPCVLKKTDLAPIPIGGDPTKYVDAVDWRPLQQANVYNIMSPEFGAQPDYQTFGTFDCSPAFDAAVTAALADVHGIQNTPSQTFGVPTGQFWTSRPIWFPAGLQARLLGAGKYCSIIVRGVGDPVGNPGLVQGFFGPVVSFGSALGGATPTYGAPLVGAGRSLVLSDAAATYIILNDGYWWSHLSSLSQLALEFKTKISSLGGTNTVLIGSRGTLTNVAGPTVALGVYLRDTGTGPFLQFILTTTSGQNNVVMANNSFTLNVTHDISANYDGGHFDCYLDGVNVGHVACSGNPVQGVTEGVSIGRGGSEFSATWSTCNGFIDSIRLSNVARHTGVGSFTPPVTRLTWDANALALFNWDQGDPPVGSPWIFGYHAQQPGFSGQVPHYCRIFKAGPDMEISDIALIGSLPLDIQGCALSKVSRVFLQGGSYWGGMVAMSANGFYTNVEDVQIFNTFGIIGAALAVESAKDINVVGGPVGLWLGAGDYDGVSCQPVTSSVLGFICGYYGQGIFSALNIHNCGVDAEVVLNGWITGMLVDGVSLTNFQMDVSVPSSLGSVPDKPSMYFDGVPTFTRLNSNIYSTNGTASGLIELLPGATQSNPVIVDGNSAVNPGPPISSTLTIQIPPNADVNAVPLYTYTDTSGSPGNATINKSSGRFAMASASSTVTITNSLIKANSIPRVFAETDLGTALRYWTTHSAGSMVVHTGAAAPTNLVFSFTLASTG